MNRALAALEESNPSLEGVLQHIDFNRRVGNYNGLRARSGATSSITSRSTGSATRTSSFQTCSGAAYEYLIRDFADSAGKKGGEFYTPRPVVQLMVRLLVDPKEGMSVYDPCSGSGGMLIYTHKHLVDNGG